ncbi:MAG TPA: hypothetical protein VMI06_09065 [Terriglobia bacterium]|nr:hypothetical protein [Terriglobia bacterium]
MQQTHNLTCSKITWQGRRAWAIENGLVRLVTLTGGGHIAEFRFTEASGKPSLNPLWVPPWKTIEPYRYRAKLHESRYGPAGVGKMLSGVVGHSICLDYFGMPSEEEAAHGLSIHGEAPTAKWVSVGRHVTMREAKLTLSAGLPVAGLKFIREIKLLGGESVAYVKETVINERNEDRLFHWTEHVTLSPPFLNQSESHIAVSATKGRTLAHGYDHQDLVKSSKDFRWPHAPGITEKEIDLTRPFTQPGTGFLVGLLLDPRREIQFISALNVRHRLLISYCFQRSDFPWLAIWEENQARTEPPWNGKCQARGLEFSSTPFPVGRREAFANGPLFGTPTFSIVPARARKTVRYLAFLSEVPEGFDLIREVRLSHGQVQVLGAGKADLVLVPAAGR